MNSVLKINCNSYCSFYIDVELKIENELAWADIQSFLINGSSEEIGPYKLKTDFTSLFRNHDTLKKIATQHDFCIEMDEMITNYITKAKNNIVQKRVRINFKDIKDRLDQTNFSRSLKDHQKKNIEEIINLKGVALFSVPGAGKTSEALAYYYYHKKEDSKLLIVAPKNAFGPWDEQLKACIKNEESQIIRLKKDMEIPLSSKICISTYESMVGICNIFNWLKHGENNFIILDESHKIKNKDTRNAKYTLGISHLPSRKIIMSGTPMPQKTEDLCPQLEFLYQGSREVDGNKAGEIMKNIFVRTNKKQLGLPKLKFHTIELEMSKGQVEILNTIRDTRLLVDINEDINNKIRNLRRNSMKLLQFSSNPYLLLNDDTKRIKPLKDILETAGSPKLEYVLTRTNKLVGEEKQVLIWSIFKKNIEQINQELTTLGLKVDYIHGDINTGADSDPQTREGKIKRFKDREIKVLIANPASCAESISLQDVCHNAIYLDRSFNLAHYLQSLDRIHRLGTIEITHIELVILKGSIDQSVSDRLQIKEENMKSFFNENSLDSENYEKDDTSYEESPDNKYSTEFDEKDGASVKEYIEKIKNIKK